MYDYCDTHYIPVLFLIPYLNQMISHMDIAMMRKLIAILFLFFSVIPWIFQIDWFVREYIMAERLIGIGKLNPAAYTMAIFGCAAGSYMCCATVELLRRHAVNGMNYLYILIRKRNRGNNTPHPIVKYLTFYTWVYARMPFWYTILNVSDT